MSPTLASGVAAAYFAVLILLSWYTSRSSDNQTFFIANKRSPWFIVAFGMVGASLSGITFVSVPGEVASSSFVYFQLVIGYIVGIAVIALYLLPLYYRLEIYSIYEFLGGRFGYWSHKTGAIYFLAAQIVYSAFKLYLMASVLQIAIFDAFQVPFIGTVALILFIIWLYTFRSGIQTVLYTDVLQTFCLLAAVIFSIAAVFSESGLTLARLSSTFSDSEQTRIFVWDWASKDNFFKLVATGAMLTIVTNGLDQSVMQKHLTCQNLNDARKNMFAFSVMLLLSNILFLSLGFLLYMYAVSMNIGLPEKTDDIYPILALNHLGGVTAVLFLVGITAAAFSSADSALTAMTTSTCVDLLGYRKGDGDIHPYARHGIHCLISIVLLAVLMAFHSFMDTSMIRAFVSYSGFTYGPLLGLYAFGLLTAFKVNDKAVPWVCLASPLIAFLLKRYSTVLFFGYQIEYETLLINGAITFTGLLVFSDCLRRDRNMTS